MRFILAAAFLVLAGTAYGRSLSDNKDDVQSVVSDIKNEFHVVTELTRIAEARVTQLLENIFLSEKERETYHKLLDVIHEVQKRIIEIEEKLEEITKEQLIKLLDQTSEFVKHVEQEIETLLKTENLRDVAKEIMNYFDQIVKGAENKIEEYKKRLN